MSEPNITRKVRGQMHPSLTISPAVVTDAIASALQKSWANVRGAPKLLARQINANEHTASNLLEGRNAPSSATLIKLMAEDDEVFAAVMKLAGKDLPPAQEQIKAIKAALAIMEGKSL